MSGKKTWSLSPHSLPYPLAKASVVVDYEENFALIIGGMHMPDCYASSKIIVFTEDKGFAVFKKYSMCGGKYGHVAQLIPQYY